MSVRDVVRNNWPAITITVTAAAIAWAAVVMLLNLPPRVVVMATGPEGDAYYEVGKRYRAALARAGVDLRLVPTAGSVENLGMLLDGRSEVSVALIEGGINNASATSRLESLGTVFYEPLWWFRRREIQMEGADSLPGRKISIGPEGSGTRALAIQSFENKFITEVHFDESREALDNFFKTTKAFPGTAANAWGI